jgi:pyrroloquinoline quinone biosynthesis protein E
MDFHRYKNELTTDEWLTVLQQARAMGATQLGFSGGEPLVRQDLEVLIRHARELGYYSNLITSGIGMDEVRIKGFKEAGLDHIQVSFQASSEDLNNYLGGTKSFQHKLEMARQVKAQGYPMVLCVVLHRMNIDSMSDILDMAAALKADYVELANTQYYGWALHNVNQLLPTRDQLQRAEVVAHEYQERFKGRMRILYVVPDYYEERPKACMSGWGNIFLTIAPDGTALPCQAAAQLPGIEFPNVRDKDIEWIWKDSPAFNRFRGFDWMKEPCRDCPERFTDFGGCRCQAFALTGDPTNADPVCSLSPHHEKVLETVEMANRGPSVAVAEPQPVVFRNVHNAKSLMDS